MPQPLKEMVGKKFGRVQVVSRYTEYAVSPVKWLCKCSCGKEFVTAGGGLRSGKTKSCGCLQKELISKLKTTHGQSKTRLYKTWSHMIERCTSQSHKQFYDYGGRGIKVCEKWLKFEEFRKWATDNGYSEDLTIDRIDTNGNYEPGNCRWTDSFTQQNNTRRTIKEKINGETKSLSEWAIESGLKKNALASRYRRGLRGQQLIEPLQKSGRKR